MLYESITQSLKLCTLNKSTMGLRLSTTNEKKKEKKKRKKKKKKRERKKKKKYVDKDDGGMEGVFLCNLS